MFCFEITDGNNDVLIFKWSPLKNLTCNVILIDVNE